MPRKARWIIDLPAIQADLLALPLDRELTTSDVAGLLGIKKRWALKLLRQFGIEPAVRRTPSDNRRHFAITREQLLRALQGVKPLAGHQAAVERRERLARALLERKRDLIARRTKIDPRLGQRITLDLLPATVRLSPGHLHVSFDSVDDLGQQLYDLSRALIHDYETVVDRCTPLAPLPDDRVTHGRGASQAALLRQLGLR